MLKKFNIKKVLSVVVTALIVIVLFGVIFVKLDLVSPSPTFFLELFAIISLVVIVKFNWYNWAEEKRSKEDDLVKAKEDYDSYVDKEINDIYDLENFLKTLNEENRENYVKNKLKNRTKDNCPKYDELKEKYIRLSYKRVKEIKASDIKTRGNTLYLADAKNYQKEKKIIYQTVTTIGTVIFSTILACIGFQELMLSWANAFRYISYLFTIAFTMHNTISTAYKNTEVETLDHLTRLQFIVDKYVNYKEGKRNG